MLGGQGRGWLPAQNDVARNFPKQQLRKLKTALEDLVDRDYSAVNKVVCSDCSYTLHEAGLS